MVTERQFGELPTGEAVKIYHLENASGAYAEVLNFGAILVKLCVPDRKGTLTDVVLGYDSIEGYLTNGCFFGSTIGRSGNRIEGAKFLIHGKKLFSHRMKTATIYIADRMGLRKSCGMLQRRQREEAALSFPEPVRMERMDIRVSSVFLFNMS